MHYKRWRTHGDPTATIVRLAHDPALFWAKVDKNGPVVREDLGPCWLWLAGRTGAGYGAVHRDGKQHLAHRIAYELLVGPPPERPLCLDHLCRVRHCVNPAHTEIVTLGENVLRGESPTIVKHRAGR